MNRELLQQALDALMAGPDVDPIFAGETEEALRAALAAPIITYGPPAERAESWPNADLPPDIAAEITRRLPELFEDDAPPAAPQGEPVAFLYQNTRTQEVRVLMPGQIPDAPWQWVLACPLYTAPPAAPEPEPVAVVYESPQSLNIIGGAIVRWAQPLTDALPPGTKLYASPPAAPSTNPAPGYCKHCKQYTVEAPLPAAPSGEEKK